MKSITNKTRNPIKISLPGGKFLHLGPSKTGQIADRASERPSVQRLVKAGEVEILADGARPQSSASPASAGHAATHGHTPTKVVRPMGDR